MSSGKEWTEWNGGSCPVPSGTIVDIRDADGTEWEGVVANPEKGYSDAAGTFWEWDFKDSPNNIVAYRVC